MQNESLIRQIEKTNTDYNIGHSNKWNKKRNNSDRLSIEDVISEDFEDMPYVLKPKSC